MTVQFATRRAGGIGARRDGLPLEARSLLRAGLKHQLEGELDVAGVAGGGDDAEGTGLVEAVGAGDKGGVGRAQVHVIHEVEHLGTELEIEAFREAGVLNKRQIPVEGAGGADVTGSVAVACVSTFPCLFFARRSRRAAARAFNYFNITSAKRL